MIFSMGTRFRRSAAWCAAGLTALLTVACQAPAAAPAGGGSPPALRIGRYASANPGSVNTYWIDAPQGLILVDTLRTLSDARKALTEIRRTGRPIVAILLTHAHPDHVGGAAVFHDAYPKAPIYASAGTAHTMRTDPAGFYALTHRQLGADFPDRIVAPDHLVAAGSTLTVGGLRLETAQFGPAETDTQTAYYDPATRTLFPGDLVSDRATPALLEGHTCGWLDALGQLSRRFPQAATAYPGHGAPAGTASLIAAQRTYLTWFRTRVRSATDVTSAGGATVTAAEEQRITTDLNRQHPGYPSVASLPTLVHENIVAVAHELAANATCAA